MNKKAIFLDIDGTLVAHHQTISPKVKEALKQAKENGHYLFICTGRNKASCLDELAQGPFDGLISSAGSYIEINHQVVFKQFFSAELVDKVSRIFNQNEIIFNYECTDVTFMSDEMIKMFATITQGEITNSEMERLIHEHQEKFNALKMEDYDGTPVHKISFVTKNKAGLLKAKQILNNDLNFIMHQFNSSCLNGEIINHQVNKGTAVTLVADYLGIDLQDTIAFGDSMNDYEMILTSGCGIAMASGSDELKKVADRICLGVEEDGIYDEFINLGLI